MGEIHAAVAWLPQQIDYIPTPFGVAQLRGRTVVTDCDDFNHALHVAHALNAETAGHPGYYTAFYDEEGVGRWTMTGADRRAPRTY
jgi:hypothetical protein